MSNDGISAARPPWLSSAAELRLDRAQSAARSGDHAETARQFETLFATLFVRELRRAMPEGPFGKGAGADVYEGWFDEHLGQALGARDALGIGKLVASALQRSAEAGEGTRT